MVNMEIYHGSNVVVTNPKILTNGFYKDFGYGFYCTNMERQARRWAMTKRGNSVLNVFRYCDDHICNKLIFNQMNADWLAFIVNCRRGIEHNFDIVEGPMADDTIWNFVEDYVNGDISKSAFWELVKFRHPTHQIVFCTERSLQCIHFERSLFL